MEDQVVLSFHDSLLHESDVKLLDSPCWLNDNIIAFTLEAFEQKLFGDFSNDIIFISPQVGKVNREVLSTEQLYWKVQC